MLQNLNFQSNIFQLENVTVKEKKIKLPDKICRKYGKIPACEIEMGGKGIKFQGKKGPGKKTESKVGGRSYHTSCSVHLHRGVDLQEISSCNRCKKANAIKQDGNIPLVFREKKISGCDRVPNERNKKIRMENRSAEKPHECDECGKKFILKGNLKRHFLIHTGERPYQCNACQKTFNQKTHLRKHLRTHIVEKPNKCPKSRSTFSQSINV